MSDDQSQTKAMQTRTSVERIQKFDIKNIDRPGLGEAFKLTEAIAPARRLIDLWSQLHCDVLESLPEKNLVGIKQIADADFKKLDDLATYDPGKGDDPSSVRQNLIDTLRSAYDSAWQQLHPYISYSVRKSTDFMRLENEARSVIQQVTDSANGLKDQMGRYEEEANSTLETIRNVAAEQGVSQQAIYFKDEADKHSDQAQRWLKTTIVMTVVLAVYATGTLFLHKWAWISPKTSYENIQMGVSKALVFATLSFYLLLSAKNYAANRHNAVINKHRQNALITYQALVKAAGDEGNRDIVLMKASECIFAPQSTGFGKSDSSDGSAFSVVSVGPGAIKPPVS